MLVAMSVLALDLYRRDRRPSYISSEYAARDSVNTFAPMLPFPMALLVAAFVGFISLCYEIVWYRLYSFASGGPAQSFAYVPWAHFWPVLP